MRRDHMDPLAGDGRQRKENQHLNLRAIFGGILPLFVMGHFSHHVLTAITVPLIPFIRSAFDLDYTRSGLVV